MISIARRHHAPPEAIFIRADATSPPLRTGTADAVVATFPTGYIYQTAVLEEVRRVLKPHGRLVVVMTGELRSAGVRRRCIRAITRILEGDPEADDMWPPAFPGFAGHFDWTPTAFGRALVYVGEPMLTTGGDCSPPPGVAAAHEPGHRPAPASRLPSHLPL
jgi:SAM-dependent methyltransferase